MVVNLRLVGNTGPGGAGLVRDDRGVVDRSILFGHSGPACAAEPAAHPPGLGRVEAGAVREVIIQATVPATASGTLAATARISADTPDPDADNNVAVVSVEIRPDGAGCGLDIDADGAAEVLADGRLVVRYLLGLRGTALVDGAVDLENGARTAAQAIEDELARCVAAGVWDIDDNARADALTDGMLMVRYLLDFDGDGLIGGAVDPAGNRTGAETIAGYLGALLP